MPDDTLSIIQAWKKKEPDLAQMILEGKGKVSPEIMEVQLNRFKQALCHLNDLDFPADGDISPLFSRMEYQPLNIQERLSFIESRITHRHSFIQLRECFNELEKLQARAKVLRNKSQKKAGT
ncbi:MAG: hypothetical protein H0Z32_00890 [Bacillaceae bacterium]|nr:hypothetical protein [Bacillaceae bacterium]